jgi:hypothetical protein
MLLSVLKLLLHLFAGIKNDFWRFDVFCPICSSVILSVICRNSCMLNFAELNVDSNSNGK